MSINSALNVHHISALQISDLSSFGYYLQFTNGRILNFTPHDHNFFEVVFLVSGQCVHTINNTPHLLRPGNMSIVLPGQIHFLGEQSKGTNVIALSFACEEMNLFLKIFPIEELPQTVMTDYGSFLQIHNLCKNILQNHRIGDSLTMRALLGIILSLFAESKANLQSKLPENIENIFSKINNIDTAAEGISAFLRISSYSYSQLSRITKQYLGKTPGEYINTLRLQFAYEMITDTNLDYEFICEKVGFSSFSHFCKLIHSSFGLTPAKLRKQTQNSMRTV